GRDQGSSRVPGKERRRAPQNGVVQIVAQIRDHPEPGIIYVIGSGVLKNAFQYRRSNQGDRNDGPRLAQGRWNQLLQEERRIRGGKGEKAKGAARRTRVEHAIENRSKQ